MQSTFHKLASAISRVTGSVWTFFLAILIIAAWVISGPFFNYSDTWQLVINTTTTILTFLMVFLIQNTQNRDTKAIHLKLDELIKSSKGARNKMLNVESLNDDQLEKMHLEFEKLSDKYELELKKRREKRHIAVKTSRQVL